MACKYTVCSTIQCGIYEMEALLLCKSLRHWHAPTELNIVALFPSGALSPSNEALERLREMGVTTVEYADGPTAEITPVVRKLIAMEEFERSIPSEIERVVWLDSDTLCLMPLDDILGNTSRISVCPVRRRNVGILANSCLDSYWTALQTASKSQWTGSWTVNTTNDRAEIRPYFNSGVVCYPSSLSLFTKAHSIIKVLKDSGTTDEWTEDQRYFSEQAALSTVILNHEHSTPIELLDLRWNCPWGVYRNNKLQDIRILHHHHAPQSELARIVSNM